MKALENLEGRGAASVVLHVDDDPNDLALMRAAARKSGAALKIRSAEAADEALDYLQQLCRHGVSEANPLPKVILLDVNLPRENGWAILQWIQAHPVIRDIPVVVLSGSDCQKDRATAYAAGAASYLVKPLGFEPLVALVSQISGRWCEPNSSLSELSKRPVT